MINNVEQPRVLYVCFCYNNVSSKVLQFFEYSQNAIFSFSFVQKQSAFRQPSLKTDFKSTTYMPTTVYC